MAITVVDLFEAVQVDEQDRDRRPAIIGELVFRDLEDRPSIPDMGQDSDAGAHFELCRRQGESDLGFRQCRDLQFMFGQGREVGKRVHRRGIEIAGIGVADAQHADAFPLEGQGSAGIKDPDMGKGAVMDAGVVTGVADETDLAVQHGVMAIGILARPFDPVEPLDAFEEG